METLNINIDIDINNRISPAVCVRIISLPLSKLGILKELPGMVAGQFKKALLSAGVSEEAAEGIRLAVVNGALSEE